jgi:hypothetical protein
MLYRHHPAPPQVCLHCRNPRCNANLKTPTNNRCDAFCCRGCERQFYGCRCRVCESLFDRKTSRRQVCQRTKCRYQFQHHSERYFGSRPITPQNASIAHNAHPNPLKMGVKSDGKSGRALRIVAGPEVPDINLRILPVPAPKANRTWQKAERRATRKVLIQYVTPPVNIIGGYRFPGAPAIDLRQARAAPAAPAIPTGDGLDIPAFLRRTLAAEAVLP